MYTIETRDTRKLTGHLWLPLGAYPSRTDALFWGKVLATELAREVRVIRYRPEFEVVWNSERKET